MDLYFSPLACSMASRIVVYEGGGEANFVRVDTKAAKTADGQDYLKINPKGLVPAIRTDEGEVLTENAAVLQYLGDRFPDAQLTPDGFDRYLLQQWLNFIATELHKLVFTPVLTQSSPAEAKSFALSKAPDRWAYLEAHLDGRDWLLDRFTVADAYLSTVLNWAKLAKLDLSAYPHLTAYRDRVHARPSVAKALSEESALFQAA